MHFVDDLGNGIGGASYSGGSFQSIVNVLAVLYTRIELHNKPCFWMINVMPLLMEANINHVQLFMRWKIKERTFKTKKLI